MAGRVLAERGDRDELRARADAGDGFAAGRLTQPATGTNCAPGSTAAKGWSPPVGWRPC